MTGHPKQRGVAIITALLIVAIATTVSVTLSTRLQLDVRRTGNIIAGDQAYLYTLAAESWSRRILKKDQEDNDIDHLGEDWAIELPPLPLEGGYIQGKLTDLQSCFNLNSLLDANMENNPTRSRLERLLENLGIDKGNAQAVIDWIDADLETTIPDGAEDGFYMNLERPYRSANTAMVSTSELRLIKGFDDTEVYNILLPYVCAFGSVGTPINVNTASIEVLRSLGEDLSESDAEQIIAQRDDTAFNTINEFTAFNNLKEKITSTEGLSVDTEYFMLTTESTIGQISVVTYSVIQRDKDGNTRVITRSQGVF
jgi:general secretion pathway protein K